MSDPWLPRYAKSQALFARAAEVIPAGIYGHTSPAITVPGSFPYYAERSQGCRYWDVDGNEFIDYMCGYGPIVLGYQHPEVEEAVARQTRDGNCFNHPTARMVELAEKLVHLVDFADWAVFGKNGTDMTSWAVQLARAHTRRKKILKAVGSYHGIAPWCTPGHAGWIEEDRLHIHDFVWNNLNSVEDLLRKYEGQIAALITTPFHHPSFASSEMPKPGFFSQLEKMCREKGVLVILDDIRAGFRLHLGGSHRYFGFTPDISCYCKAIGNGHPIAAAVGSKALRVTASKVFLTGSYWNSAAPMAAALATLKILERDKIIEKMRFQGEKLMQGLSTAAHESGFAVAVSGPPAIPLMMLKHDRGLRKQQLFCLEAAKRGVFFHPHHNWFMSGAHEDADIEKTLAVARECFQVLKTKVIP
jgi:glutamate-1-semialdehyde 2,1-aminomutase